MTQSRLVVRAMEMAVQAHRGQMYGSEPYYTHPYRVMQYLQAQGASPTLRAAALLHDVVEVSNFLGNHLEIILQVSKCYKGSVCLAHKACWA